MVTLTQEQARQTLTLLTAYANSGVSDEVSLECARVCRVLRETLSTADIGRDLAAITPEQRAENVRLTVEGEQKAIHPDALPKLTDCYLRFLEGDNLEAGLLLYPENRRELAQIIRAHKVPQVEQPTLPPLLAEFARDMQAALGEDWETYERDIADLALHWPRGKVKLAKEAPDYARTYMLDTAKSAAVLLLLWLQLRRVARQGQGGEG